MWVKTENRLGQGKIIYGPDKDFSHRSDLESWLKVTVHPLP